jgi:glutamate/tyrosine decarboxylase-like PLP-dependent enzyme
MKRKGSRLLSMFIGPKGENIEILKNEILYGLDRHKRWRSTCAPGDPSPVAGTDLSRDTQKLHRAVEAFLDRLERDNPPYFHPRYSAQMLKDPSIPALIGYFLTMLINPNNHAYEGGPATTEMEMEVIEDLQRLVGFENGWGHLTSGGSLANLEALWAVRNARGKGKVLFSVASHLSWKRICNILDIREFKELPVDRHYRLDMDALKKELAAGDVLCVMANFGTTGCGAVDPLDEILSLREQYGFHLHVDAAYGGYFRSLLLDEQSRLLSREQVGPQISPYLYDQAAALCRADSITIDPHKHGLMPYGAGSVLYRHEELRQAILNTAPYTYHVKEKPNIGMFTLEGSRPGAAAAGCWLVHQMFPLFKDGIGSVLDATLSIARRFAHLINSAENLRSLTSPELDIFCFYAVDSSRKMSAVNRRTLKIYNRLSIENPRAPFILSKLLIDKNTAARMLPDHQPDADYLIAMRSVFMKHWMAMDESSAWLDELFKEINKAVNF